MGDHVSGLLRRSVIRRRALFLLVFLVTLALPATEFNRWFVEGFESGPLRAESSLHSLTMDDDGMLWMVHENGLLRFDGRNVRLFDPFSLGFTLTENVQLLKDGKGKVWLRDELGTVLYYDRLGWHKWREHATGSSPVISRIATSWNGEVLLLVDGQIWSGDEPKSVLAVFPKNLADSPGSDLHRTEDGTFWLVNGTQVWMCNEQTEARLYLQCSWDVEASCIGSDGYLYLAGHGQLCRVKPGDSHHTSPLPGNWRERVSCLVPAADGRTVLLGTQGNGLWRYDPEQQVAEKCLLEIDPLFITDLVPMKTGPIWMATLGGGLICASPQSFSTVVLSKALSDAIFTLDEMGGFWGARKGEIWKKGTNDPDFVNKETAASFSPLFWTQDADGAKVLICNEGMVRLPRAGEGKRIQAWSGTTLGMGRILSASFASDGTLFLSQISGLSMIRPDGSESHWSMDSCTASSMGAWERKHLVLRDNVLFSMEGAEPPRQINNPAIQNGLIALAGRNGMLLGLHSRGGVGLLTESEWLPVDPDGLFGSEMILTENSTLWLLDKQGITVLNVPGDGGGETGALPCPLTHFPFVDVSFDQWGVCGKSLWWKKGNSLFSFDGSGWPEAGRLRVSLERLYINGRERQRKDWEKLVVGQGDHLQLKLLVPRLLSSGEPRVMYRLLGMSTGWQPLQSWGDNLLLSGLETGTYRLETAVNAGDGRWQDSQAQLIFAVRKGFRAWPVVLSGVLLTVLSLILWRLLYRTGRHSSRNSNLGSEVHPGKYSTSGLSPERAEEIRKQLLVKMDSEKPYLQASLTLRRLADLMGVHTNHLSQVINNNIGQSSKDFINQYRIKAAAERLAESNERSSIMDIAFDCGFYSKSVFNAAFKKMYGVTPSEYREQHKEHQK